MDMKTYLKNLTREEKVSLAEKANTSVAYLSQLANGHRKAGLKTVIALENASDGALTREAIRPDLYAA